jgi:hypothetical protein
MVDGLEASGWLVRHRQARDRLGRVRCSQAGNLDSNLSRYQERNNQDVVGVFLSRVLARPSSELFAGFCSLCTSVTSGFE